MELSNLRIFVAVLDTASVTRAADVVGLTPGAVSQQLRSLSKHLGAELFVRSGRSIVPTAEAERLAVHARSILHQVRAAELEFARGPGRRYTAVPLCHRRHRAHLPAGKAASLDTKTVSRQ